MTLALALATGTTAVALGIYLLRRLRPRRLATGGVVTAPRTYVVGDHGPELFVPTRSGTIIPNDELPPDVIG